MQINTTYLAYCVLLLLILFLQKVPVQAECNSSVVSSTPEIQLEDNRDGTVTDLKTGLMWKQCPEGVSGDDCDAGTLQLFDWKGALERPGVVNGTGGFAGYTDWRLPNIKELFSIVEEKCFNPAINERRFPNTPSTIFWSNSVDREDEYYDDDYYTWMVNFYTGQLYVLRRNVSDFYGLNVLVRLVRDEISSD